MRLKEAMAVLTLTASFAGGAHAAVTSEEAAQLGRTLTAVGAEQGANTDGSIPAYTGGLASPPAGFKVGGPRLDPYAGEKPTLVIDGRNVAAHADRVTEGSKALLRKYPEYRLDVYPTHRSAAFPAFVTENTAKCATAAVASEDGRSFTGCRAGYPFPIPANGVEAMWNHLLRFGGLAYEVDYSNWNVDASGRPAMSSKGRMTEEFTYWNPAATDLETLFRRRIDYTGPARRAGDALLVIDPLNFADKSRRAWQYMPGTRRIQTAPDLTFDTPVASTAGNSTYDDANVFGGSMERYHFRLAGKKEMYIPYNAYRLAYGSNAEQVLQPGHLNPDLLRWELHRVWVVEATLREGARHAYSRRVFYLDEDSWVAVASDQYDAQGQLFRSSFAFVTPSYEVPAPLAVLYVIHDFRSGGFSLVGYSPEPGAVRHVEPRPDRDWTPGALVGSGLR
jgi:hypothetical protein